MVDVCGRQKLVSVFLEMNDAVRNGLFKPHPFPMGQEYCDRSHCGFFNWKKRGWYTGKDSTIWGSW
jgi:hypothetical protein